MEQLTPNEKALQLAVNVCTVLINPDVYYKMLPSIKNDPQKRKAFISEYVAFRTVYTNDLADKYYKDIDLREYDKVTYIFTYSSLPSCINNICKKNNITYTGHISQYNDIRFSNKTKDFVTDSCKAIFRNAGLVQGKDFSADEYNQFLRHFFIPDALSFKKNALNIFNNVRVFHKHVSITERILSFMRSYPSKFWAIVFCGVSLLSLIFFVPYKTNIPATYLKNNHSYESMNGDINYGTFSSKPNIKKELKQYTDISYGRLGLQEVIIGFACAGGFIITTSKK